jgi:hypothetical protein
MLSDALLWVKDRASFKDRGTTGTKAVSFNSMGFNSIKYENWTKARYEILGHPKVDDLEEVKKKRGQFAKKHGPMFYKLKGFRLAKSRLPDGTTKTLIKRADPKDPSKLWTVVKEEDVFESIRDCHESVGYKKVAQTFNECNRRFYNITKEQVRLFVGWKYNPQ